MFFFCILHWMDIYFKRLIIYQRNITINISDIIHYFLTGPKLKRLKLPSLPPTNKNIVIAVKNYAEAVIKVFCSCSIFLDFFTLFQKLYPWSPKGFSIWSPVFLFLIHGKFYPKVIPRSTKRFSIPSSVFLLFSWTSRGSEKIDWWRVQDILGIFHKFQPRTYKE